VDLVKEWSLEIEKKQNLLYLALLIAFKTPHAGETAESQEQLVPLH